MINHTTKQAGGTLLGLIIGLIIGLGIAVGVAMTIKNTPLPFNNKLGKQEKLSVPGQTIDPNKPLYGNKEPAKEAAKDFAKKAEDQKAADELEAAKTLEKAEAKKTDGKKADAKKPDVKKTEPKQAVKPDAASDTKPAVVDKSTAEKPAADKSTADKSQKTDAADEKFTYYLQAGAFLEQGDAENTKAKLALLGFSANIAEKQSDNGILYRVRIGPFGQLETMNRLRGKLTDNGVDVAVIRIPK